MTRIHAGNGNAKGSNRHRNRFFRGAGLEPGKPSARGLDIWGRGRLDRVVTNDSLPAKRPSRRKALWLLAIVGFLAIVCSAAYLKFTYGVTVGSGPAGPAVAVDRFRSVWTDRPVLLIGLGDSITAGFGARSGYSYFERLKRNPPEDPSGVKDINLPAVLPQLRSTNLAVSGSTSGAVFGQISLLPPVQSDVLGIVTITTGGNDLIHSYGKSVPREEAMYGAGAKQADPWIRNYEERLERIVREIQARFPGGCHIFLGNIYDPTDGVGDIQKAGLPPWRDGLAILRAYNATIKRCADRHANVHLVDLHSAFLGHGIHSAQFWSEHYHSDDPHYWYYTNLEDPNERGYDAIRRLFLNSIADVLCKK